MFRLQFKKYIPALIIVIFACYSILSSPECNAQGLYKISDKIGGSSTPSQTQDNSDNNTTLLIIGAAAIIGLVVYTLVIKNDEKKDSTSNQSLLNKPIIKSYNSNSLELKKLQHLPVNFYVGIQRPDLLVPERKFIMGISYNF
jgi:hypothetical protein